jgi:shikimate dehydrogenase
MIYNPPETRLLHEAHARGMVHSNGLSMLVHQGARSLELWTGESVDASVMQAAAKAALARNMEANSDA